MLLSSSSLSLVVLLSSAILTHCAHKDRHKLVSRIQNYTLLHIAPEEVDADTTRLSFDAFGEHYEVELWRNAAVIASAVAHTNVHPSLHPTSAASCHYHGRVVNAPSASLVALSMCAGRGIRGHIVAFNETLIVRPSAYYLDLSADARGAHSVTDELLVYRESDFDRPLVLDDEMAKAQLQSLEGTNSRRRLYSSYSASSPATTKMAMMIGPVRVANFQADYGSEWYAQLFLETADMVNLITAWYEQTNWGSMGGVGSVRVVLAEVFVLYSFDGLYRSMMPTHMCAQSGSLDSSSCTASNGLRARCSLPSAQFDDSDVCAVNHGPWLDSIIDWVYANKNDGFATTFDNVQFVTDMKLRLGICHNGNSFYGCGRVLGVAYPETMCTGARSLGLDSVQEEVGGASEGARTIAHELGHNFGLYHDGQSGPGASCAANEGLMGYSDGVGFSRCSVASMQEYFEGYGQGMTCLRDSFDGTVVSNVNGGVTVTRPPTTTRYTASPTPSPVSIWDDDNDSDDGCLTLSGFDDSQYDGAWSEVAGGYDGRSAYRRTDAYSGATNYLFYYECASCFSSVGTVRWVIGSSYPSSSGVSMTLICTRSNLMDCAGGWMRWGSFGWSTVYGSQMSLGADCGSNTNGDDVSDSSCSGYSCVFVYGSDVGVDGWYSATSACHNGQRVYADSSGSTTYYLCFADTGRWALTSALCSTSTGYLQLHSATSSTNVLHNSGYYVYGGSSSGSYSSSVGMASCSQGLEGEDEDTDGDVCEPESEELCLHGMTLFLSEEDSFTASDGACSNERAVYSLTVTNASATNELDAIEAVFYVHFADFLGDGRWVLTEGGLSTARYLALCDADSVLDCFAGAWSVRVMDDDLDLIRDVLDEVVYVTPGSCDDKLEDDDSAASEWVWPLLGGVAVSLALLAALSIVLMRRRRAKNVDTTMMAKEVAASATKAEEVGDASGDEEEDEELESDQEVVVEVETAFARQANLAGAETATAE